MDLNKQELAKVIRTLAHAEKELEAEWDLSESPAVAKALQDVLEVKAKLNGLQ